MKMLIFKTKKDLIAYLSDKNGQKIGFVPTMGALHKGHISLIERCKSENTVTVASVFVNPTQFNNSEDLKLYPRTEDNDVAMLTAAGCDVVFIPSVSEMYDEVESNNADKTSEVNLGVLASVMEGAHRPGHFAGVMQVVAKFFDIIHPYNAYFGQKDIQQLAVIKAMIKQLNYSVKIVACPTVRESDGLAMSSRNVRLSVEDRKTASNISKILFEVKEMWKHNSIDEITSFAVSEFKKHHQFHLDYFEIVDVETFLPANDKSKKSVACVALIIGGVRLIDNIILSDGIV